MLQKTVHGARDCPLSTTKRLKTTRARYCSLLRVTASTIARGTGAATVTLRIVFQKS